MKTLYIIGGTMGVGKTTVSKYLKKKLPNAVFLDGDWCWDADPFVVTDETKEMVMNNICYMLNSFIRCSAYDNIVFCWVMHEQGIIDFFLKELDTTGCEVKIISLTAKEETLRGRILSDVAAGFRNIDSLERSLTRIPLYEDLGTEKIRTDGKTIAQISDEIVNLKLLV